MSKSMLSRCNQMSTEDERYTCQTMFSAEYLPILLESIDAHVGGEQGAQKFCSGLGFC